MLFLERLVEDQNCRTDFPIERRSERRLARLGRGRYFTPSRSTSNISVAFGGMTPPAPLAP